MTSAGYCSIAHDFVRKLINGQDAQTSGTPYEGIEKINQQRDIFGPWRVATCGVNGGAGPAGYGLWSIEQAIQFRQHGHSIVQADTSDASGELAKGCPSSYVNLALSS